MESQKNLLERQLGVLRERLRQFVNDQEIQQLQEQEQEQELQGTASDDDYYDDHDYDGNDDDGDEDSSGFLNFSIEYDDADASSSRNHSPPHTPQHL